MTSEYEGGGMIMSLANEKPVDAHSIANRHCLEQLLLLIAGTGQSLRVTIDEIRTECQVCQDQHFFKKTFIIKLEHLYVLDQKLIYMSGVEVTSNDHLLIPFDFSCNPIQLQLDAGTIYSTRIRTVQGSTTEEILIAPMVRSSDAYFPVKHLHLNSKYFRRSDYITIMFDESLLTGCRQVF